MVVLLNSLYGITRDGVEGSLAVVSKTLFIQYWALLYGWLIALALIGQFQI